MVKKATEIFRDFETDGVSSSGAHKPIKADIRDWGTALESASGQFSTVALMVAATNLTVGMTVRTLGYYTAGDGGGNTYRVVAAATGTEDGGAYINLTGSRLQAQANPEDGIITLRHYGAKGDGVTDDTTAWTNFQAARGLKIIPPGRYLVSGEVRRFDQGVVGNGVYADTVAAWNQLTGDLERDSLIVHGRVINANSQPLSPAIKVQTVVDYNVTAPNSTFKRISGAWYEQTLRGHYNTQTDQNNNFTVMGAATDNRMAGLFGSLASTWYCQDAKESENPTILTEGATKNGCTYFQPTRRAKYSSGGYMFGTEVIFLNTADEDPGQVYSNNDEFAFTAWTVASKITAASAKAPISTGILINGSATAAFGFWNGVVIGGSAFKINGVGDGVDGTVGINMASWRTGNGYADIGIKFRTANRHLYFREGCKVKSFLTRIMNDDGDCGVQIEAATGSLPYLKFGTGADTSASPTMTEVGAVYASSAIMSVRSQAGEVQLNAGNGAAIYKANSARFAPGADNSLALGGASNRWSTVYAGTGTINTSDERLKQDIKPFDDAALAAWADVNWCQYRFKDSVVEKSDNARVHFGLIAQRVVEAFKAHGLDAMNYGLLCYDKWDASPEVTETRKKLVTAAVVENDEVVSPAVYEDETIVIQEAIAAGDRFGVRYEEALCIEAAYQRRRADSLEARIAALEAKCPH